MTYVLSVLPDKPTALWMLDDSSPYQDHSGYGASGTGTNTTSVPLVPGAAFSSVFKNTTQGTFTPDIYLQGKEDKAFTIEAWVLPIPKATTGEIAILSHTGLYDGLTITDKTVQFSTLYDTAGEAAVTYELQTLKKTHIVAVHSDEKNYLYIDGTLVAEVELTDAQILDVYDSVATTMVTGQSATAQEIAVNGLAVYPFALPEEAVARHFAAGMDAVGQTAFLGESVSQGTAGADLFLSQTWNSSDDWNDGITDTLAVSDDLLIPDEDTSEVSIAGEWLTSFPLDYGDVTSIESVSLDWVGQGVTVSVSDDDIAWETVVKGKKISLVTSGMDPTDIDLTIRVEFPGGITNDTSYLESLTVNGFETTNATTEATHPMTISGAATIRSHQDPFEFRDDAGYRLDGGSLTIQQSTDTGLGDPKTLELWVKRTNATAFSISGISGTEYRNGVADTTDPPLGEWALMHITTATAATGNIVISGNAIISHVSLYENQLSATDIAKIYQSFTGYPRLVVDDTSAIGVTETAADPQIYAHEWAITGAGG